VGNVPSRASVELFRSRYGADYGSFRVGGTRCVFLNSQLLNAREAFWKESRPGPNLEEAEAMADAQDAFLDGLAPGPTLVFSHIPPFVEAADEPKGYFNHEPAVRRAVVDRARGRAEVWAPRRAPGGSPELPRRASGGEKWPRNILKCRRDTAEATAL